MCTVRNQVEPPSPTPSRPIPQRIARGICTVHLQAQSPLWTRLLLPFTSNRDMFIMFISHIPPARLLFSEFLWSFRVSEGREGVGDWGQYRYR